MSDDRSIDTGLPDAADDEITTDVDPEWIAAIRAGTEAPADEARVDGVPGPADDWASAEPAWDPEATVGASSGLIERIRQEIASPPASPAPVAAPTAAPTAAPASVPAAPAASATPRRPPAPAVPPSTAAPTPPPVPATGDHADVATTVRWEPRQRLTTAAPITESAVITPPTHSGLDHTKLAIAIVAAITLIVVAWLVVGSRGGSGDTPPADSVPTSGVESTVADSVADG